jgi:hypothetical protein
MSWETFLGALSGTSVAGVVVGFLAKALIEQRLKKDLEEQKSLLIERATVRATVDKYSRVILISASDLQDRLWHLCVRQSKSNNKVLLAKDESAPMYGSWPMTKRHYLVGTMYMLSRYFCWVEILKRKVRFLEFGDEAKTSAFNYHLKRIERMFAETDLQKHATDKISTDKPLFQLMQVEIGECLRVETSGEDQCMSFHDFRRGYDDALSVNEGLQHLETLVLGSMSDAKSNFCLIRLILVCNALLDLILFLNKDRNLSPPEKLERIPVEAFDETAFLNVWPPVSNPSFQRTAFGSR